MTGTSALILSLLMIAGFVLTGGGIYTWTFLRALAEGRDPGRA